MDPYHVPCLTAREGAKTHWKSGLSSTVLELPTAFCSRARLFSHAEGSMFDEDRHTSLTVSGVEERTSLLGFDGPLIAQHCL